MQLGLIWVWPESGPDALLESSSKEPAYCQLVKDVDPGVGAAVIARTLHMPLVTLVICMGSA